MRSVARCHRRISLVAEEEEQWERSREEGEEEFSRENGRMI